MTTSEIALVFTMYSIDKIADAAVKVKEAILLRRNKL